MSDDYYCDHDCDLTVGNQVPLDPAVVSLQPLPMVRNFKLIS